MNKKIDIVVPEECYSMVDCWEAIMTIMLNFYNKDYNVIYSSSDFYYEGLSTNNEILTLEKIFYKTFSLNNQVIIEDTLSFYEQFLHLEIELKEKKTFEEMRREIEVELEQNRPVTIFIDTFLCKFNRMYNKFYYAHAIIISGIEDDCLLIVDPTQHMDVIKIKAEDIYNCAKTILKFKNSEVGNMLDTKTLLRYNFSKNNFKSKIRKNTRLENIGCFFNEIIMNKREIYRSFENAEESLSIMFSWLFKNTAINIKNYSNCLEKNYFEKAKRVLILQRDCQNKWMLVGKSFMKMFYSSQKTRDELFDKLCSLLKELYTLETKIYEELMDLLEVDYKELKEVNYNYV